MADVMMIGYRITYKHIGVIHHNTINSLDKPQLRDGYIAPSPIYHSCFQTKRQAIPTPIPRSKYNFMLHKCSFIFLVFSLSQFPFLFVP